MCIICASMQGVRQPTKAQLRTMFNANPHGAGYMTARDGRVEIKKGFMTWQSFAAAVGKEHFTDDDPVVYHFRISTQAGTGPAMTHPFMLTKHIAECKFTRCASQIGVAHNGIISLTTNPRDKEYSDTAHFVAEFLAYLIRDRYDMQNPDILSAVERLAPSSKFAFMDDEGNISTAGSWIDDHGLLFSNHSYLPLNSRYYTMRGYLSPTRTPPGRTD